MQSVKRFLALSLVVLFAFGAVIGCGGEEVDLDELEEELDQPMEPAPSDQDSNN